MTEPSISDPRFTAALGLLERTGVREIQVRYSDDEQPVLWMVAARWQVDSDGRPVSDGDRVGWNVGAGMNPLRAVFALCDQVVGGGQCTHCRRPAGFAETLDPMPLPGQVCWYQWDPELKTFRRACEGD